MISHWTEAIEAILSSQTGDLRELAQLTGKDPSDFYTGQDLSGCDLRGQDLRGMNFSGCNIEFAILDSATKIDSEYDPRIEDGSDYWEFNISAELNTMVLNFMKDSSYIYTAWAYRNLIESAFAAIYTDQQHYYDNLISSNPNLQRALNDKRKISQVRVRALLYGDRIRHMEEHLGRCLTEEDGRWMMMLGLLRHRVRYNDKKDYSNLSLNAFYPPKLIKVERSLSNKR